KPFTMAARHSWEHRNRRPRWYRVVLSVYSLTWLCTGSSSRTRVTAVPHRAQKRVIRLASTQPSSPWDVLSPTPASLRYQTPAFALTGNCILPRLMRHIVRPLVPIAPSIGSAAPPWPDALRHRRGQMHCGTAGQGHYEIL